LTITRFWRPSLPRSLAALTFVIAVLCSFASQPAEATSAAQPEALNSNSNRVVSAAIMSEAGIEQDYFVVWMNESDQSLHEAIYNGHVWLPQAVPKTAGLVHSSPTISIDLDPRHQAKGYPYQYAFWQGGYPRYGLYEDYWNGSWSGPHLITNAHGPLGSAPSTQQTYDGGQFVVAWRGTDGNLWYAHSSNPTKLSTWSGSINRKVGQIDAAPTLVDSGGFSNAVMAWWEGANQQLYAASLTSETALGDSPFGPCDFNIGKAGSATALGSPPSVTWSTGYDVGATPLVASAAPDVATAKLTGKCPANSWWGDATGAYIACWGANTTAGLECLFWSHQGKARIEGPELDGHMGSLGSAPSVASWPAALGSSTLSFWSSGGFTPKLIMADVFGGKPQNTGVKLYS